MNPRRLKSREEFTTVYDIIDSMEATLEAAKTSLFAPSMVRVDREEFAGQLDELSGCIPVQLERSVRADARGRAALGIRADAGERHHRVGAEPCRRHVGRGQQAGADPRRPGEHHRQGTGSVRVRFSTRRRRVPTI